MADEEPSSEELAEERTDFAEDRTIMAAERTYAGWLRTAFAAVGIGVGFHALFGKFDPPWVPRVIATLFILLGVIFAISAQRRVSKTFDRLSCHAVDRPEVPGLRWISWAVAAGAAVLIAALWFLRIEN